MSRLVLKATERDSVGTGASKAIRRDNKVPGVLYGKGMESIHLSLDEREISRFLSKNHVGSTLDIDVNSKKYFAVLKNVQYNSILHKVNHVDFQRLQENVAVRVTIPVFVLGKEDLRGVFCQEILSEVEIECLAADLVDSIEIRLDNPEIGEQVTVGELEVFKSGKVTPVTDPESIVYIISELTENIIEDENVEEAEVEAAEPELVGEETEE